MALEDGFKSHDKARTAMWAALSEIDARAHTLQAIEDQRRSQTAELDRMAEIIRGMPAKAQG